MTAKQTAHTPGPWFTGNGGGGPIVSAVRSAKGAIATFPWTIRRSLGWKESNANARPIAAAPSLLEAVNLLLEALDAPEHREFARKVAQKAVEEAGEH